MNVAETRKKDVQSNVLQCVSFPTELGWMALHADGNIVERIWFGYQTQLAAETAVETAAGSSVTRAVFDLDVDNAQFAQWVHPLQDYAAGERVSFAKWKICTSHLTPFKKKVIDACRRIPRGKTLTYGELAAKAGSPRAARAVGSTMSSNRIPIVVPCHRVVGASGSLGGYSSPRGLEMKRDLLSMEGSLDV